MRREEEMRYVCPKCGGEIEKVVRKFPTHIWWRWTCKKCQRDYGYMTPEPVGAQRVD